VNPLVLPLESQQQWRLVCQKRQVELGAMLSKLVRLVELLAQPVLELGGYLLAVAQQQGQGPDQEQQPVR
jgi:hypothetical protein